MGGNWLGGKKRSETSLGFSVAPVDFDGTGEL